MQMKIQFTLTWKPETRKIVVDWVPPTEEVWHRVTYGVTRFADKIRITVPEHVLVRVGYALRAIETTLQSRFLNAPMTDPQWADIKACTREVLKHIHVGFELVEGPDSRAEVPQLQGVVPNLE